MILLGGNTAIKSRETYVCVCGPIDEFDKCSRFRRQKVM